MITLATMIRHRDDERTFELLRYSLRDRYSWIVASAPGLKGRQIVTDDWDMSKVELGRIAIGECGYFAYVSPMLFSLSGEFIDIGNHTVVSPMGWTQFEINTKGRYSVDLFVIRQFGFLDVWAELLRQKLWTAQKSFEYACQGRELEAIGAGHNVGPWRTAPLDMRNGTVICQGLEVKTYLGLDSRIKELLARADRYADIRSLIRRYYAGA